MAEKRTPPGPKGLPFVGMAHVFFRDVMEYIQQIPTYGDIVKVKILGQEITYLIHPDYIEHVLVKQRDNYTKGKLFERTKLLFGEGLVTSEGELWKKQRRRMAPAFQPRHMGPFKDIIASATSTALDGFGKGGLRQLDPDMMALTLEIALQILFGTSSGDDVQIVEESFTQVSEFFASATGGFIPVPIWVPTPSNLRFKKAFNQLETVVKRIIEERKQESSTGSDLLGLMMKEEDGLEPMEELQLRDEVRTLLLAGHETTALGLTYSCWFLTQNPELQDALAEEIHRITGGEPVQGRHCDELTSVTNVFKEAMRLLPPAPITSRSPVKDDVIGGYDIPAESVLIIPMMLIQRDERWFPEPLEFRPERWTPEFEKQLPRFAYFPFGGGPRICIGQRMAMMEGTLILAELIRRFRIENVEDELPKLMPSITMRPSKPIPIRLYPR